ncbi:hypothetical protein RHGRI_014108 [Rhododendron griersonianum]|uniref:Zinc finger CCCH domain-containing protein 5 n=1 Tax=Rhododendron griersonianum TaxID=479676 RepID=A0AAV6K847_9ERIC|nr:hypothetical protein RHGRI_014108 [Rhododendron griersonianum]
MAEKIAGVEQQSAAGNVAGSRIERRKAAKKEKRRQKRKELAVKELEEEEARLNDPEEQRMIQLQEEREKERVERERREFEEHERVFLEALAAKRKADDEEEEEERRRKALEDESKQKQVGHKDENSDDDWEYIEEGPPEIIWQGNEIIVKKKKVRVKRKDTAHQIKKEDPNGPTSNPLPPQSEAFADYRNGFVASAQQLLDNVARQTPNFGTEQDKNHCPFHLKTGACRFGSRCNRIHFYPDKSCTLLIKNMYSGPGLAWEQDEGLECTDEEVERSYEEFYEDVHTEFLKFGEIVNFKVCKNGSSHLRGNVYIHYKSLDSALAAYHSINGRYFAGKQGKDVLRSCEATNAQGWIVKCGDEEVDPVSGLTWEVIGEATGSDEVLQPRRSTRNVGVRELDEEDFVSKDDTEEEVDEDFEFDSDGDQVTCEFIGVTKWKVAICGEYTKSRKTCSRGTKCNFIHCFCNPGGDYEWADVDRPPPKYWANKMAALFGYSEEYGYDNRIEQEERNSSKMRTADPDSYYRRYRSRERDSSRSRYKEYDARSSRLFNGHHSGSRIAIEVLDEKNRGEMNTKNSRESKNRRTQDSDSEGDWPSKDGGEDRHQSNTRKNMRNRIEVLETQDFRVDRDRRDRHHISTRDSSQHHNKVLSPDISKEKRDHDNDCREEDKNRHHRQMRKRSRHSSEGLGSIDEYANSVRKSKDENNRKESDFEKVEPPKVKKRHRSSRGDRSSMEPSETNASAEGLKSDGYNETISSGDGERTKLREIADMNEVGHKKLRERYSLRHQTSCRDSSSDESSYETQSSRLYSPRSKSHDSAYYSNEDLDKQSRWESDKTDLEKHRESERKTSSGDFD